MILRNTFKLMFTNFSLTYKIFLHRLVALLIALGVSGTVGASFLIYLKGINFAGFLTNEIAVMFENINLGNIFIAFKNITLKTIEVVSNLDKNLLINAIISISLFFVVYGLIASLSNLAVIDALNSNMSSKTKISYFKSMVGKSLKSICCTIIKFILSIPYIVCVGLIFYFGFRLYDSSVQILKVVIPAGMFLVFVIISSIHLVIFSAFEPSIIVNDKGIFSSLKINFNTTKKKFFRLLSNSLMLVFILTICNLLISVFSFFAGLIITLPITYLLIDLFKIISYYECNGMRYYVGDTIRTPLRKCESDKINKLKYII